MPVEPNVERIELLNINLIFIRIYTKEKKTELRRHIFVLLIQLSNFYTQYLYYSFSYYNNCHINLIIKSLA